jgi:hypothetical protein
MNKADKPKDILQVAADHVTRSSLDVWDFLTIVLVAAKAFGCIDISWVAAFAPLWIPWAIIAFFGILAWNYWVALLLAIVIGMELGR